MSRLMKGIENPEVPGLECLLPPPPPPPPLSSATVKKSSGVGAIKKPNDGKMVNAPGQQNNKTGTTSVGIPINSGGAKNKANLNESMARPFSLGGPPVFPEPTQGGYFAQTAPKPLPCVEQPWWIPTDSDTVDVVPQTPSWVEQNSSWPDPNNQNITPAGKTKSKAPKRKIESIDPALDAERVANAQRELSGLMKPLECDLCNAIMNSTLQAKLHYEGKPHQKKVSMFLNQSVKKIKPDDRQVTSTTSTGDWNTYCEACKTWFTSQIDANQHYAGKKHIRATTGATKPKVKKPPPPPPTDPTGRFGIGIPFSVDGTATMVGRPDQLLVTPVASPVVSPVANYQAATWTVPIFRCEPCGVTANRLEQLETHKRGAKHLRMLKTSSLANTETDDTNDKMTTSSIDYSIHRTPSGQYYCAPCNRSFQSENSFGEHIESKKHKNQVNPKQPVPAQTPASKKAKKSTK